MIWRGVYGDSECDSNESCANCVEDCGACNSCSHSCDPIHGQCVSSMCYCDVGWSRNQCNVQASLPPPVLPVQVNYNNSTPLVNINSTNSTAARFGYQIAVVGIAEVTATGSIRVYYDTFSQLFGLVSFLQNESGVVYNQYSLQLNNSALLQVTISTFSRETNVSFAGVVFTFGAETLKMTFQVVAWPFANLDNVLHIDLSCQATEASVVAV